MDTEMIENIEDNTYDKTKSKSRTRKPKNEFKEKRCEVINYNNHLKTLDIRFDGYGIKIKNIEDCNEDFITVQYKGEIGKPGFSLKV